MPRDTSLLDLFDWDIDRQIQRVNRDVERFFRRAQEWSKQQPGPGVPLVWGYTVTQGPEGEPRVDHFGNVPGLLGAEGAWEPYVNVQVDEAKRLVHVTADLPGVEKKDIKVKVDDDRLHVEARGKERTYRKTIRVDAALQPGSARAKYDNGVLDLTVELAKPAGSSGREVRVE